jgi:hypothetical protein
MKAVFIVARLQRFGWNFNISNQYFLRLGDGVLDKVSEGTMVGESTGGQIAPGIVSEWQFRFCDVASGVTTAASKSNADPNRALAVVIRNGLTPLGILVRPQCQQCHSHACFKPTTVVDESGSCE